MKIKKVHWKVLYLCCSNKLIFSLFKMFSAYLVHSPPCLLVILSLVLISAHNFATECLSQSGSLLVLRGTKKEDGKGQGWENGKILLLDCLCKNGSTNFYSEKIINYSLLFWLLLYAGTPIWKCIENKIVLLSGVYLLTIHKFIIILCTTRAVEKNAVDLRKEI